MSRIRCAVLDDYQGVATTYGDFARLSDRLDITVFREAFADTQDVIAALAPFEVIVAMRERTPFDAQRLKALPKLKLLVTSGMRNAAIDMQAARDLGITVCGTEGFAGSTAELAWGLLLSLMRNIPAENANFRAGGPWQQTVGRDLRGLTLGILGIGTLGSKMATFGAAFGMSVLAWSRNNTPERSGKLGATCVPKLDDLLAASDAISINLLLTPETRGLIGARELGLLKPGAVLINTARGPIVDEAALIDALSSGRLAGAGLDVYDREPLPLDHPFRRLPNVIATPHLGYVTENSYRAFYGGIVADLEAWLDGTPLRVLNP